MLPKFEDIVVTAINERIKLGLSRDLDRMSEVAKNLFSSYYKENKSEVDDVLKKCGKSGFKATRSWIRKVLERHDDLDLRYSTTKRKISPDTLQLHGAEVLKMMGLWQD